MRGRLAYRRRKKKVASKKMKRECGKFLLPFLNVSSLYVRFNIKTNSIVASGACVDYVDLFYPGDDLTFMPFSPDLPFRYERSTLYLGYNRSTFEEVYSPADFWKRAVSQSEFLNALGDKCPGLARDYLLSTQPPLDPSATSGGPRLILHPVHDTWIFSESSPTFGRYDCGSGCDGYFIEERGGQIFVDAIGDLLKIRYTSNSFDTCGIFGALQGSTSLSQPCYSACSEEDPLDERPPSTLFFSPNLAIYFEFIATFLTIQFLEVHTTFDGRFPRFDLP